MEDLVGRQIGAYQIVELIGEGVADFVYKAYQPSLDRHVAIKVLKPELAADPAVVDGFRRAVLAAARLSHANILRIHDMQTSEGLQYIVMDYADGGSLQAKLAAGPLSLEAAAELGAAVADALAYAHDHGLIHGDLRPSNILLDAAGHPLVADFGLAHALSAVRPQVQVSLPEYMAPEQAQSLPADQRTDVYALGLILYQAVSGHVPFRGDTPLSTLYKQVNQAPPSLIYFGVNAPAWQSIIEKALAKDPDGRFQSAAALASALRRAPLEAGPTTAEAPTLVRADSSAGARGTPQAFNGFAPQALPSDEVPRVAWPGSLPTSGPVPASVAGTARQVPPGAEPEKGAPWSIVAGAAALGLLLVVVISVFVIIIARRARANEAITPTAVAVAATATRTPFRPTPTMTAIVIAMETPTATATATSTTLPTDTPVPTATGKAAGGDIQRTVTPTDTLTTEPTATPTLEPTATATATPTVAPTETPTATSIPEPTATPVVPTLPPPILALSGHIAYPLYNPQTGFYEVWIARADGTEQHPLLACMRQPDFRADGRLIMNGEGCGTDSLWAINADGTQKEEVSRHPEDENPTWSPDGAYIVYSSTQQGDGQPRLYIQSILSKPQSPPFITFGSIGLLGTFPVWLPTGEIAYNGCDYGFGSGGNCGLWVVSSDGSQLRALTRDSSDRAVDAFGGSLVFMSTRDGNWDVYRMEMDGASLTRLTATPANDGLPTWSPDGSMVAFVSDRDGQWAVWAMAADGSGQQKLFNLNGTVGPEWTKERVTWGP
ncbi:MAG: protein kinase domain-containing protein [Anaerolineae bacterium]